MLSFGVGPPGMSYRHRLTTDAFTVARRDDAAEAALASEGMGAWMPVRRSCTRGGLIRCSDLLEELHVEVGHRAAAGDVEPGDLEVHLELLALRFDEQLV